MSKCGESTPSVSCFARAFYLGTPEPTFGEWSGGRPCCKLMGSVKGLEAGTVLIGRILGVAVLGSLALAPRSAAGVQAMFSGGSSATLATDGGPLDLNTATPEELARLPGMGPAYARRVVEGRPYSAKNQLMTRGVLPASAYEQIKDHVVAHRPPKR